MYLPGLPNCVSMFHSLTGGSSITSLTLHDLVFPCFQYEGNVHHAQYGQFYIQVSISGPTFLVVYFEIDSVTYFERWWFSVCGFLASSEAVFF